MDIRKIILEEIKPNSEWDWVRDNNPYENTEELLKLFDSYMVKVKNKCKCTYGGKTKQNIEASFTKFLVEEYDDNYFIIFLKNNMGVIDATVEDDEVTLMYFTNIRDWEEEYIGYDEHYDSERMSNKLTSKFKKLIPDMEKMSMHSL